MTQRTTLCLSSDSYHVVSHAVVTHRNVFILHWIRRSVRHLAHPCSQQLVEVCKHRFN